jgi:hypothetical protein
MAIRQVTHMAFVLLREETYGYTPRKKPAHSIQLVMENFNSLSIGLGNAKVIAINNLCRDFKQSVWL